MAATLRSLMLLLIVTAAGSTAALAQAPSSPQPWAGTITLPRADYDRLLDLASRRPPVPADAPLPVALTRTDMRARVDGGLVRVTMRIDGEVFRTGPVKVPLVKGATLLDAKSGAGALPMFTESEWHVGVIAGPAAFTATLEVGMPVTTTPGRGSFTLPVPAAGSATVTLDVPGEQTDIHVSPGLVLRRASAGGRTTVDVTLDPGRPAQIWWSTREGAPTSAGRDARFLADVKTLVTIGEPEVRLLTLVDVSVVQGEPAQFTIGVPAGYEVTSVSGISLERSATGASAVTAVVSDPAQRRHQFLISLERQGSQGSFTLQSGLPTLPAAQREVGIVAVEGTGTLEVTPKEVPGLRRVDVREVAQALAFTAGQLMSAYRYERTSDAPPSLVLEVKRFADAEVLTALAERAVVTTLLTTEGRALTEVMLWVRNRAQPFARVMLPPGASMLSVEVAGTPAKPAEGRDGTRVPLLRPGFRPNGAYLVSFVYLHEGTPFTRRGDMRMALPRLDLPIGLVEWELFVPDRFKADRFGGDAIEAAVVEQWARSGPAASPAYARSGVVGGAVGGAAGGSVGVPYLPGPGQIIGRVADAGGSALPGATVTAEGGGQKRSVTADATGAFTLSGLPSGPLTITAQLDGFTTVRRSVVFDQRPRLVDFTMQVGALTETVTVTAESPFIDTRSAERQQSIQADALAQSQAQVRPQQTNEPSLNVQNLQRRASGVLPVRMDVPRAGTSHRFYRALVVDEDTAVTFRYKRR